MKDPTKLKELIKEKVNLAEVMASYKVWFAYDPHLIKDVQFHCPFHGPDKKPSARLYNTSKSCFCWVCRKSWDVVSFVKEKEQLSYLQTLNYMIGRYKIDTSSIPDEPNISMSQYEAKVDYVSVDIKELERLLFHLKKKKPPFEKYRALCYAFCMTEQALSKGVDSSESIHKIEDKIQCLLQQ